MKGKPTVLSMIVAFTLMMSLSSCGSGDGGGLNSYDRVEETYERVEESISVSTSAVESRCDFDAGASPTDLEVEGVFDVLCAQENLWSLLSKDSMVCAAAEMTDSWSGERDVVSATKAAFTDEGESEGYNSLITAFVECEGSYDVLAWFLMNFTGMDVAAAYCVASGVSEVRDLVWPILMLNDKFAETEEESAAMSTFSSTLVSCY